MMRKRLRCIPAFIKKITTFFDKKDRKPQHWYDLVIKFTGIDPTICPLCKTGHLRMIQEMIKEISATSPPLPVALNAA